MGCAESLDEQTLQSREIDRNLKEYHNKLRKQVKMLLLGPGEAGKSTIFKQMKRLSGEYSREELEKFRPTVYSNCVSQMKRMIKYTIEFEAPYESKDNLILAKEYLKYMESHVEWSSELARIIHALWQEPSFKKLYRTRGKTYQLNDTCAYFFDNIMRIAQKDYVPSAEDAIRTRVRSTGIEEAEFEMDNHTFLLVDVGGQRSERRKWIHCFESVTAVLFLASLSGYNEVLREDRGQNKMIEALQLFQDVLNSSWLEKPAIILFLNKSDLFEEKVKKISIGTLFTGYNGGAHDVERSQQFIKDRFLKMNQTNRKIYSHITCALDTQNIRSIIRSTNDYVIRRVFDDIGIV